MSLRSFIDGYIEAFFFAETDESDENTGGDPLDDNYSPSDLAPEARKEIENDCKDFYEANEELFSDGEDHDAGADFYFSRNGHGTGFWDRDWENADELHKAAKGYGTQGGYAHNGKVYTHG